MKKEHVLRAARRKAGIPMGTRGAVIRYVCLTLQCEIPATWEARYRLLKAWAAPQEAARDQLTELTKPVSAVPQPPKPPKAKKLRQAASDAFLASYEWRELRMKVIVARGNRCECCGASPHDGIRINVDHVKPRKLFPELALVESNLQILCDACNHGKANWDQTDWRPRLVKSDVENAG